MVDYPKGAGPAIGSSRRGSRLCRASKTAAVVYWIATVPACIATGDVVAATTCGAGGNYCGFVPFFAGALVVVCVLWVGSFVGLVLGVIGLLLAKAPGDGDVVGAVANGVVYAVPTCVLWIGMLDGGSWRDGPPLPLIAAVGLHSAPLIAAGIAFGRVLLAGRRARIAAGSAVSGALRGR